MMVCSERWAHVCLFYDCVYVFPGGGGMEHSEQTNPTLQWQAPKGPRKTSWDKMESSCSDLYLLKTEVENPDSQPVRPAEKFSQTWASTDGSSIHSVILPSSRAWNSRKFHRAGTLECSTQTAISAEVVISGPR